MHLEKRFQWGYFMLSTLFLSVLGAGFHFLNDWTANSVWTVWFAPVNESIWEHLKLLFFPGLLLIILDILFSAKITAYPQRIFASQVCGIFAGMLFITAAYYTVYGITGRNFDWLNITLFVTGCVLSQFLTLRDLQRNLAALAIMRWTALLTVLLFLYLFVRFTHFPPQLPFFMDMQTGIYGIH